MKYILRLSLTLSLIACTPGAPNSTTENQTPSQTTTSAETVQNPASSTTPASSFRYLGITQDVVPASVAGAADGKADHGFELSHRFAGEVTLKSVIISRIENGRPNGVAGWSTTNAKQYWILKVRGNGVDLNDVVKVANLNKKVSNDVRFEFFGSDAKELGLTKPGTEYELALNYTDASGTDQTLTQRVKL